ncbi:MAG: hypothetical protein U0232_27975 [Thermomicrobiales bacterium]
MVTMLDRCPAWTTENLTALGTDVEHVRTQLDWLLEDLEDAPDARVGYLESQLADCSSDLARLDNLLDELRLVIDEQAAPDQSLGNGQSPLATSSE